MVISTGYKTAQNRFIPQVEHSLLYNPYFDALRGIAVTLVLFYHIYPKAFRFGYLGVDIFFVLSGYLITRIIVTKLSNGNFSFFEFYRNRIRRIFPSMIIVLLAVLITGYFFLFPAELTNLAKHIRASAFFYQNFQLIGEAGYWDQSAKLKPLLHFWSLSVEEQFYFFWPFLLFYIFKWKIDVEKFVIFFFIFFTTVPFFLHIDPFYNSLSRFWELLFGAFISILDKKVKNKLSQQEIFFLFLLSSLYTLYTFMADTGDYVKILAIILTSGIFILYFENNNNEKSININVFVYVLIFLGLISYPLYLWHYAIISYLYIFNIDVQKNGIFIILTSILLSYITYRYIEIKARNNTCYSFALILVVIVFTLGLTSHYIREQGGLPKRPFLVDQQELEKQFIRTTATNPTGINLLTKLLGHSPHNNYVKASSDDPTREFAAVIGDSHAHTSYPGFAKIFQEMGLETVLIANSSCPPYLDSPMGKTEQDVASCREKIKDIYTAINKLPHLRKVILATRAPCYMYDIGFGSIDNGTKPSGYHFESFFHNKKNYNQKRTFQRALEKTLRYFSSQNRYKFYFLIENPELGFSPKNCTIRPFGIFDRQCAITKEKYLARAGEYRNMVKKIASYLTNIHVLDPENFYCDDAYCYVMRNGGMLYADDDHHSVYGAIEQAIYFKNNHELSMLLKKIP